MTELLSPFHTAATALVSLLPPDAGELATGTVAVLGILLTLFIICAPFIALGAWLDRRDRRTS